MLELIFVKLLEISIQASFFILAVVLIRFCFKRLPKRYACILWALVAVRLVLPFEITSTFSLVPDTSRVVSWADVSLSENVPTSNNQPSENPLIQDNLLSPGNTVSSDITHSDPSIQNPLTQGVWQPNTSTQNNTGLNATNSNINSVDTDGSIGNNTDTGTGTNTDGIPLNFDSLLSCIGLLGMLAFLTYDLVSYLRLKFRMREAIQAQDNIWYSDQIPAPFVLGYLKPRIYIPFSIQKEQMPYIIAHEQAHISHFDHLTKLLAALLVCVYWFNPFIWIAYLLYCKDLELACDERVIAKLGTEEKKPYSEALLICSVTNKALLQSPLSFSEVAIKDRIVNILNYKKPGFWGVVVAVAVCVVVGVCFLTSPNQDNPETTSFIQQTTPDMLNRVTKTNYLGNINNKLPDTVSPDAYYYIISHGDESIQLYALVNNEALIIRDNDTLYPLYNLQELTIDTKELAVYKSDYDSDGTPEFALYKLEGHGSGYSIMGITMLEIVDGTLQLTPFTLEDMRTQLERISYRYAEAEETIYISVDSDEPEIALDVSWLNYLYGYPFPRLHWGDIIDFEERDGQWWIIAKSGVLPDPGVSTLYICGATFTAPITYNPDRTFLLGDISVELYAEKPNSEEVLSLYADQLAAFPGEAQVNEAGQLVISDITQDYDCRIVTDPDTSETVYIWPFEKREYLHITPSYPSKEYPLEIVDGVVQEVSAQILNETAISQYAFGADVLEMTYQLHPYGTKQYILRDNGTLNVNIGYEAPDHISFQNLTFRISAEGDNATLTDYGSGYYLLQLNNVESLKAFRNTYTGAGHVLPADTSQLPWDWLLALNDEENDAPILAESDLPAVNKSHHFTSFVHYNLYDFFDEFIVSEKVVNGEVFTEYRYQDDVDDISILTDIHSYEVVSITYNGEEKPLPDRRFVLFTGGTSSSFGPVHYADVTGDMQKELIFEEGSGGTGIWENYCYIFNPETMEQYPINLNVSQMTDRLNVTLTEFNPEDSQLHYHMEYEDQTAEATARFNTNSEENAAIMKENVTLADANEHFSYIPEPQTHNTTFNPETGRMETEVWLYTNHITFLTYIGELRAAYVWDEDYKEFVLDLDTVELEGYD